MEFAFPTCKEVEDEDDDENDDEDEDDWGATHHWGDENAT
jgi:hypothetical protein